MKFTRILATRNKIACICNNVYMHLKVTYFRAILANERQKFVLAKISCPPCFMYAKLIFSKHLYQQNVQNSKITTTKNLPVKGIIQLVHEDW